MAYDHYAAICHPLLYTMVVSRRTCCLLLSLTYLYSFSIAVVVSCCVFSVSYCSSYVIDNFYCPPVSIVLLWYFITRNTSIHICIYKPDVFHNCSCIILFQHHFVHSKDTFIRERKRAFSTCASHMTAVSVFYGILFFMYLQPQNKTIHWILIKWPPCFAHWWSPCWIPWSTAWGTRTWRLPWGYLPGAGILHIQCILHIAYWVQHFPQHHLSGSGIAQLEFYHCREPA